MEVRGTGCSLLGKVSYLCLCTAKLKLSLEGGVFCVGGLLAKCDAWSSRETREAGCQRLPTASCILEAGTRLNLVFQLHLLAQQYDPPSHPRSQTTIKTANMGAWGYGLFQSDHDFDIISDLSYEVGLDKLQLDAEAEAEAQKTKKKKGVRKDFWYQIYQPSDVDAVRQYLETPDSATGISPLDKALSKWEAKASGPRNDEDYPDSGYIFVLLCACTYRSSQLAELRIK